MQIKDFGQVFTVTYCGPLDAPAFVADIHDNNGMCAERIYGHLRYNGTDAPHYNRRAFCAALAEFIGRDRALPASYSITVDAVPYIKLSLQTLHDLIDKRIGSAAVAPGVSVWADPKENVQAIGASIPMPALHKALDLRKVLKSCEPAFDGKALVEFMFKYDNEHKFFDAKSTHINDIDMYCWALAAQAEVRHEIRFDGLANATIFFDKTLTVTITPAEVMIGLQKRWPRAWGQLDAFYSALLTELHNLRETKQSSNLSFPHAAKLLDQLMADPALEAFRQSGRAHFGVRRAGSKDSLSYLAVNEVDGDYEVAFTQYMEQPQQEGFRNEIVMWDAEEFDGFRLKVLDLLGVNDAHEEDVLEEDK